MRPERTTPIRLPTGAEVQTEAEDEAEAIELGGEVAEDESNE